MTSAAHGPIVACDKLYLTGGEEELARRRGRQRGYLRQEGPSWIGYWWEEVRLKDGTLDWHRVSRVVSRITRTSDKGRESKVTRHEAQRVFQETILDKLEVRSLNPQSLATLKEFVELKFRPTLIINRRRKTREHWRNMLDNHILPALGSKQLREIRPDDVQNLVLQKLAAGLQPQTVWHVRTSISTLFKKAKLIGWYSGDLPTYGIEMPELIHQERTALTRAQAIDLLERLPLVTRAMALVLAMTGLRIGELCGLRWKRVNLASEPVAMNSETLAPFSIAVREAYVRVYGKGIENSERGGRYQEVKTRKSRRDVPLVALAVRVLEDVSAASKFTKPDDPVFAGRNGTPIDAHNELARKLKPALIELGLPDASWHSLRHTMATFADQAGLTEAERQRLLGHSNASMTRHYTHAEMARMRGPMEQMAEGFDGVMGRPQKVVEIDRKKAG